MGYWKALGPDKYQSDFFKKTWKITNLVIHQFVQGVLKGDEISEEATKALLVLVPKETKSTSLKNFRLIILCNASMKLVTKMIANMLKMVLNELITPNQAFFIQ